MSVILYTSYNSRLAAAIREKTNAILSWNGSQKWQRLPEPHSLRRGNACEFRISGMVPLNGSDRVQDSSFLIGVESLTAKGSGIWGADIFNAVLCFDRKRAGRVTLGWLLGVELRQDFVRLAGQPRVKKEFGNILGCLEVFLSRKIINLKWESTFLPAHEYQMFMSLLK